MTKMKQNGEMSLRLALGRFVEENVDAVLRLLGVLHDVLYGGVFFL